MQVIKQQRKLTQLKTDGAPGPVFIKRFVRFQKNDYTSMYLNHC
jgi:hypothetical protein